MSLYRGYLLVDANVLIDYLAADLSVLTLASQHLGAVNVLSVVLAEVDGLDEDSCRAHGLTVIEPDLSLASEAAEPRSSLSFEDRLCLIVARDNGWSCVTNDRALRRACAGEGVPVVWGLQVLKELVRLGALEVEQAVTTGWRIHERNPLHISKALVERFVGEVGRIGR